MLQMRPSRLPPHVQGFEYVRQLVRRNSAIVLDQSKDYLIEARLSPIAEREGLKSVDELIDALRAQNPGKIHGKVVEALTTNETHFFRDIQPFRILGSEVIPQVVEARSSEKKIKIWSAACSTGQEPYSIVMALKNLQPRLFTEGWDISVLGTDLNEEVLQTAREATYKQLDVNRGLPARDLVKHFDRQGATWRIKKELRELCSFEPLNLVRPWPALPQFDIVFLRNVLIYFDTASKVAILEQVANTLRPGGFLFLGAAETTVNLTEKFTRAFEGPGGCYQLAGEESC